MDDYHANDFREWHIKETLPVELGIEHNGWQKKLSIPDSGPGLFHGEFASFNSFLLSQQTIELDHPTSCSISETGQIVRLYFNLAGSCIFQNSSTRNVITPGLQNIYFCSQCQDQVFLQPENGKLECLEIHVPVAYYVDLLSGYSPNQTEFINGILKGNDLALQVGLLPMTMPMKWIINTLKQCSRTGLLRRLFFEAKILELLMLQIEQSEYYANQQPQKATKPSTVEAYHEAKKILESNLDNPPTIRNLARMVGINEFDLKKGFKDTFNTTIYGYVNEIKMQQAKQMLLEGDKSIQEIASLSGYKNPQHFTTAFKRYFGQLPSKLKTVVIFFIVLQNLQTFP